MPTILLAEDEREYRELLAQSLTMRGYVTHAVDTGHEAIAVGARVRPHVLIADWLLHNHIHGLHVAAALRALDPQLRTILITGFDAKDLRTQAAQLPGCRYLKKPFRRQTLLREVAAALQAPPVPPATRPIAVVEIDVAGRICYANPAARALFATTLGGRAAQHLTVVVDLDPQVDLDPATAQWREVVPRLPGPHPARWWLGVRTDPDLPTRLLVLAPQEEESILYDPGVRLLLNLPEPPEIQWTWSGAVLLIDADGAARRRAANQFAQAGVVSHTAATPAEGLGLFQRNPAINIVILADSRVPSLEATLGPLVAQLQQHRPLVRLVGTSTHDRQREFAALGVRYFVRQPWRAATLYALLARESDREAS